MTAPSQPSQRKGVEAALVQPCQITPGMPGDRWQDWLKIGCKDDRGLQLMGTTTKTARRLGAEPRLERHGIRDPFAVHIVHGQEHSSSAAGAPSAR